MKLSLFILLVSLSSFATFYGQVNGGQITADSKNGVKYDGTSLGVTLGKRFSIFGLEVGGKQKKYGLKEVQGSLTKADYVDQEVSVGLRLFLGSYITASAGATQTNTEITFNNGGVDTVVNEDSRTGFYYEGGIKIPTMKGGPTFFANYRFDKIDDIENVSVNDNFDIEKNQSINIGLSKNF